MRRRRVDDTSSLITTSRDASYLHPPIIPRTLWADRTNNNNNNNVRPPPPPPGERITVCCIYLYSYIYIFIYTSNSARGRVDGGEGFSILLRVNNGFYTAAATAALGWACVQTSGLLEQWCTDTAGCVHASIERGVKEWSERDGVLLIFLYRRKRLCVCVRNFFSRFLFSLSFPFYFSPVPLLDATTALYYFPD